MFIKRHKKLIICLILILLPIVTYTVDSKRAAQDKKPIFAIRTAMVKDGGTIIYKGLGYKVIKWNKMAFRKIDGKDVHGNLVGCEISTVFKSQDINNGPKKELKFVANLSQ